MNRRLFHEFDDTPKETDETDSTDLLFSLYAYLSSPQENVSPSFLNFDITSKIKKFHAFLFFIKRFMSKSYDTEFMCHWRLGDVRRLLA